MNRNYFWRTVLVVLIVLWSLYELYPPKGRDLVQYFRVQAVNRDPDFTTIFTNALALQKAMPEKPYENLLKAIGTNDITRYFPSFGAKEQLPDIHSQPRSAGRRPHSLGLDPRRHSPRQQDTTDQAADAENALSHAVEVLRRGWINCVAEPLIQPQGNNRILVQLPGLSAADQESAKAAIQRAAFLEFRLVCPTSEQDIKEGIVQPGYEILKRKQRLRDGREHIEEVEVRKRAEMDGSGLKSAMVVRGNLGEPEIHFTLDSRAPALLPKLLPGECRPAPRHHTG